MKTRFGILVLCLSVVFSAGALEVKPSQEGVAIDAGAMGAFTLSYPQLIDDSQKVLHKLVERQVSGASATLKYADGAQVLVSVSGGSVKLKFLNVPGDVKKYLMDVLIDPSFSKGGSWRIGEMSAAFPREKPASPHLFQGNANTFRLMSASGDALTLRIPDYSYQELNDNREWGWTIFALKFIANLDRNNPEATITVGFEAGAAKKLVDAFGQSIAENFPGKVKSVEELKADVAAEKSYFDSLHPPERDRFGGLLMNLALKKTGFFHTQMDDDGKQWLVDPDGNAFFHFGVCSFNPGEDYTYVKGREKIYEWLPPHSGEFASAFREGNPENFSFHLANTIRKYGKPYDHDDYARRMIGRVRKLGFNSIGAFSRIPDAVVRAENFPYVAHLPLSEWEGIPRVPGVFESFDPFDEATRAKIAENIAKHVPQRANDPLLIGWFIVNEPRFDEIPKNVPALNGKHACKRKLVAMLAEKYKTIEAYNAAWSASAKSFDELNDAGLAVKTDAARKDLHDYTGFYLEAYFSVVNTAFRKHDPNHLLIGARYQPQTINDEQLCRITGKYCDVMSFNYYTYGIDKKLLQNVYEWSGQKPVILSEFFWSSPRDSGLAGGRDVSSQRERGLAYRNYVEQSAALGFVIGIEWFTLIDQSVTGRWFSKYNGESANTGLFSVTDRPWKECVSEMMKTNYEIYDVLLRKRAPFAFDDARFR